MMPTSHEVTRLVFDWRDGDHAALTRLLPLVHAELKRGSDA
jgi:hypothetical protein